MATTIKAIFLTITYIVISKLFTYTTHNMSQFAYYRFLTNNMLTIEEMQHKDEIIRLTEEVLDAKGIQCDSRISKISVEQLIEILEEVRRKYKKNKKMMIKQSSSDIEAIEEEQIQYIR